MGVITSRDSRTFKELQRLTQKKYRDREGLFLAEGPNITGEALGEDGIDVVRLIVRQGSGYEPLYGGAAVLSAELFDSVSDTITSQGIMAVIRRPDRGGITDLLRGASSGSGSDTSCGGDAPAGGGACAAGRDVIVLDRLQDPGNIGTIIRTAEGAGIGAAVFIKGTCDPYSPKVVRACAGSILRMPITFCESAEEFIRAAREAGYRLAVTDVRNGVPYYESGLSGCLRDGAPGPDSKECGMPEEEPSDRETGAPRRRQPVALVIGNEGNGVSDTFLDAADILVNIPMRGKLESLNASVAAALLMYEMARPAH